MTMFLNWITRCFISVVSIHSICLLLLLLFFFLLIIFFNKKIIIIIIVIIIIVIMMFLFQRYIFRVKWGRRGQIGFFSTSLPHFSSEGLHIHITVTKLSANISLFSCIALLWWYGYTGQSNMTTSLKVPMK